MKKLLIVLFIFGISTQIFAEISSKQVVGKWNYTVVTNDGDLKGILNFVEKEGKLAGEVITDDGNVFPLTKIELKEGDILYFELQPEYDVYKGSVKIEEKKFKGTVNVGDGEFVLTGEKQE